METLDEESVNQQNDLSEEDPGVEPEDTSTLTEIKQPFDPKKIDIDTRTLTLDLVIKRLKANPPEIDLYPDFQRKEIWNKTKQSRLIESILIRLQLPAFYFDGSDENKWLVVDGLQRLSTLKRFVVDKSLVLENLEYLTQLHGKKFEDLPREFQRRIEEAQIIAYIIKPGTPEDVKYNIFYRINTGGEPMSPQEIRHALNQGKPANFVAELANNPDFKKATGNISPERMLDRDFVNRFVAFYLTPYENYTPDLNTFLKDGIGKIKPLSEADLKEMENNFTEAMKAAHDIFGNYAFRKIFTRNERRKPISKAMFEVWSVLLAKLSVEARKNLILRKDDVLDRLIKLMNQDKDFIDAISEGTGDKQRVSKRFSTVGKLIQQTLSHHAETPTN